MDNTCVGYYSGRNITSGTGNVLIGHDCQPSAGGTIRQISLGTNLTSIGQDYITFGNNSVGRVYNQYSSNATWTHSSDERKKKDINTNTDCGLNFINDLRTVTYKWKAPSELPNTFTGYDASITEPSHKEKMYGFIAQEVKSVMDKHDITDFNGWNEDANGEQGISYEMFVMPLVKAIQELSAKVDKLENGS